MKVSNSSALGERLFFTVMSMLWGTSLTSALCFIQLVGGGGTYQYKEIILGNITSIA